MTLRDRANAFILALLITMIIFMPMAVQSQISEECCEQREFELFLVGEPDDGILTPFYSELNTEEVEVEVTSSIGGEVKIATWDVTWRIEGEYLSETWEFSIPYKLQGAAGFTLNATLEVKIGGDTYEGSISAPEILLTGEGNLEIPVEVAQGDISEGDLVEITLSVQNLVFTSPGEDTGVFFVWGSEEYDASIRVKLPLLEILIKDPSVTGNLVYLPVMIKSGFEDDMWSKSNGIAKVQNIEISESPIAILRDIGVEVTFVWEVPANSDGIIKFEFELIPQPGLIISSNKTHEIVVGEDSGPNDWYPEVEPLRDGGSTIEVDIDTKFKGNSIEKQISIEFDGAMSQWIRWGLDNIGNSTLDSNSWWKNLNSYSDSIKSTEKHNGKVDDSEIRALKNHLIGSRSDLRSFFANGLYLEIESIIGINPIDLGPTEININMGATRAFSSEEMIITIETSYAIEENQRQLLVENFIRPSSEQIWDEVSLDRKSVV